MSLFVSFCPFLLLLSLKVLARLLTPEGSELGITLRTVKDSKDS